MEQRERLIKLLRKPIPVIKGYNTVGESRMSIVDAEKIADHILADGWIRPPCKVGDRLYYCIDLGNIVHGQVLEIIVIRVEIQDEIRFYAKTVKHYRYNYTWFDSTDIGKTVFLTREEAEAELERRNK